MDQPQDQNEIDKLRRELERLRQESDARDWGLRKTNEGIRLLYKELEEKNRRLREIDEMKSSFLSLISHELRTPIAIVKESCSQLLEGLAGPLTDNQIKLLDIIKKNVDRLRHQIDHVIDLSHLTRKESDTKEVVDLRFVVQETTKGFEREFISKGVQYRIDIPAEPCETAVAVDWIRKAINHLVDNALKYTPEGSVTVRLSMDDQRIRIDVEDTGIGMDTVEREAAEEPFIQLKRQAGSFGRGLGLGLAIVRRVCELHGGRLIITSRPQKGSCVSMVLPRSPTASGPKGVSPSS